MSTQAELIADAASGQRWYIWCSRAKHEESFVQWLTVDGGSI